MLFVTHNSHYTLIKSEASNARISPPGINCIVLQVDDKWRADSGRTQ
jgi:hypothetical protein